MGNSISPQFIYQLAEAELKKQPKYEAFIPVHVLREKVEELSLLSDKEIQEKINEYFAGDNTKQDGWAALGVEISNKDKVPDSIVKKNTSSNVKPIFVDVESTSKHISNFRTKTENEALDFMDDMLTDSSATFNQQIKQDNWVTKGYNSLIKETFDTEYAKSNVKQVIDNTKNDIYKLQTTLDFQKTFEETRGVKYNPEKLKETKQKAEAMVKYQAYTDMVKNLKAKLAAAMPNTTQNTINRNGERALLNTLATMGYTNINEVLQSALKGHENDQAIKNYVKDNGKIGVRKDQNAQYGIYYETKNGHLAPISQEMAQIIAEEVNLRLNQVYAQTLGISEEEYSKLDNKQLEELTNNKYNELKTDYEQTFSEAYGKKDLNTLAQNYMLSQQEGQAYIQAGFNFAMMGLAMFSGGTTAMLASGAMVTDPIGLVAKATDYDGMSKEDWQAYGQGVLEQAGWMALGMGAGKVGDMTRSFVKVKGLSAAFKQSGQSLDDFLKTVNMTDVPQDIAKTLRKVKLMSEGLGVTAEVATDLATTYMLQKDGATTTDWIMSITTTLAGTQSFKAIMDKIRANHSNPSQMIKDIKESFSAMDLSDADAMKLIDKMKEIEAQEKATPKQSTPKQSTSVHINDQVNHINQPDEGIQTPQASISERLNTASIREDFVALRDEIKAMEPSEEKTKLMEEYSKKYTEYTMKQNGNDPDVYDPKNVNLGVKNMAEGNIETKNQKTLEEIKSYLSTLTKKDRYGNNVPRFNSAEIESLSGIYTKYPEAVKKLEALTMKDSNGNEIPRFNGREIEDLAETYTKYPEVVDKLGALTTENSYGKWPRLYGYTIKNLAETYTKYPEIVDKLLGLTTKDSDDNENPRFEGGDIEDLVETYIKYPEVVDKLLGLTMKGSYGNEIQLSAGIILHFTKAYTQHPEAVKKLEALTMKDSNGNEIPRFGIKRSITFAETYTKYPETVDKLLGLTTKDSNGNEIPRFDGREIEALVETYTKYPETVDKLLGLTTKDSNGNEIPRFDGREIKGLVETYTKYPETVDKLLGLTTKDSNGNEIPRFDGRGIEYLAETYTKYPETVDKLLGLTIKDSNGNETLRFNYSDIVRLAKKYTEYPEAVDKLLGLTIKDSNGNEIPRFDGRGIEYLAETYIKYPEAVKLLTLTMKDFNGNYVPRFDIKDFQSFVPILKKLPPEYAKMFIDCVDKLLQDSNFDKNKLANILYSINVNPDVAKLQIDLADKLLQDSNFDKNKLGHVLFRINVNPDVTKLQIDLADKLLQDTKFDKNNLSSVLFKIQNDPKVAELQVDLAKKLIEDSNFDKNNLGDVLFKIQNDPKVAELQVDWAKKLIEDSNFDKNNLSSVLSGRQSDPKVAELQIDLAKKLIQNSNFDQNNLRSVLGGIKNDPEVAELQIDLAKKLIEDSNFDKNNLGDVLFRIQYDPKVAELQVDWANKFLQDPNFDNNKLEKILININQDTHPFLDTVTSIKDLDKSKLPEMLEAFELNDGAAYGTDTNKIKRYTALFQNPKTSQFMVNKINSGMDIDTAAFLCKTQQKLNIEKQNSQAAEQNSKTANYSNEQSNTFEILTGLGLNEKEANAIIKSISKDGVVDSNLQTQAVKLINEGVPKNKIGDILSSAKIEGEFNQKIVDDFVAIQNMGLNPLLEKNLAILNNIKGVTVAEKFNSKVKNQLKAMIERISPDVRAGLEAKGFDFDSITAKLNAQKVRTAENVPVKQKIEGLRNKSGIKGFEKIIVDKYNPEQMIWANEAACKKWAEDKYSDFKSHDYHSVTYPDANKGRDEILKQWFDFMDSDPDIKDNPFVKILITEYITKDLAPENAWLPPAFDKAIAKDILNSAVENSQNFSFANAYAKRLRESAMKDSGGEQVKIDGIKGKWYTVPQTDNSSPDFKKNADRVRAFSDGTNWCIRTYNAEPYIQQGNIHFFVDENGLTQVCVRETSPGSVYEIQKRQQDGTVPIPYINVITDFMDKKGLKAQSNCQSEINAAVQAKPEYDALKVKLQTLAESGNYKAIFEEMGITVTVRPDNTYQISHYSPKIGQFILSNLGIKENDLLENVSVITGDADFKDSNVTTLSNLEEVGGRFIFQDSNISDVRKLKTINGYQIVWE